MKKKLALIFAGESEERKISSLGAAREAARLGEFAQLLKIGIARDGSWYIYRGTEDKIASGEWERDTENLFPTYPVRLGGVSGFLDGSEILPVDAAYPLLHGEFGEDGCVQGALATAHIPYIGTAVIPSAITADKAYTKIVAEHLSIPTLPWIIPSSSDRRKIRREAEERLGYPMFIKPRTQGSSIGAAPVFVRAEFYKAYDSASSYGEVIIERLAEVSLELEFAHFHGAKRFISNVGIIASHGRFYDYAAKYEGDGTPEVTACGKLDLKTKRRARSYARRLADFLSLGNISRIDFFLTPSGELYFNEINSIPGATLDSLYPRLTEAELDMPYAADILSSGEYCDGHI